MAKTLIKLTDAAVCNGADLRDYSLFPTSQTGEKNLIFLKGYSDGSTVPLCDYLHVHETGRAICNNNLINPTDSLFAKQLIKCPECRLYTKE